MLDRRLERRVWKGSHIIENLSINPEDFKIMPILTNVVRWNRANQTFIGQIQDLIRLLNKVVAA